MHYKIHFLFKDSNRFFKQLLILSKNYLFLFILFWVNPHNAFSNSKMEVPEEEFKAHIKLLSTFNCPVSSNDNFWSPFITGGLQIAFPVGVKGLEASGVVEYGLLRAIEDNNIKVKTGLIRFLVAYSFNIKNDRFILKPFIGVMDMMIHHNEEDILESVLDTEVFKNVENEFGVSLGFEPLITFKRITVSLPIFYDLIFSSPNVYQSINTSLAIGLKF